MPIDLDTALDAAWTLCAPERDKSQPFPRGFWPDVARVAGQMIVQDTLEPVLNFQPTHCGRGGFESPKTKDKKRLGEAILNDIEGLF